MKHIHDLRAFLKTNAALEVRNMIPSALGNELSFRKTAKKEVPAC